MIFQNEAEVLSLLQPIIDQYKKADGRLNRQNYKPSINDYPEFYPGYRKAIEYSERIKIHSELGPFPEQLFIARSPNQTDKEFNYMKDNYKQNTLPVYIDYLYTNKRCFNDGNWSLYYKEQAAIYEKNEETFQDYVEKKINGVGSLENYVKDVLASLKSVDAHGVVAVKPQETYSFIDEATGDLIADNSELIEPQPVYYSSKQVLSDSKHDEDYFIIECNEKSEVTYRSGSDKVGHIFEVYDEENIWRVEQVGKFTDYKFEAYLYFSHSSGKIPATRLKGVPQIYGESLIWQSPFIYACDLLDLALMNENYLQCSISNTMFPYRVMLGSRCENQYKSGDGNVSICNEGKVFDVGLAREIECPKCKGAGILNRVSPMGEMLLFSKDLFGEGETKMVDKAMYYVSPDTTASEFVLKKIDRDILKAYDVIKAKPASQSNGKGVSGDGTATAAVLDTKAQLAVVKTFSDQVFSIYEFLLDNIGWQRYGVDYTGVVLSYPVTFDFNTEQDYLSMITQGQAAKLPAFVIQHLYFKYLSSLYYNEKKTAQIFTLILACDRLLVYSRQDVFLMEKFGDCLKWEAILHDSAIQFVDELMDENADAEMCSENDCNKGFFALDFATQKEKLIQKAKDKAAELVAPVDGKQKTAVEDALSGGA